LFGVPFAALVAVVVLIGIDLVLGPADPSARYFPTSKIQASHLVPGDVALIGPANGSLKTPTGPVSRPDPRLTPGVVALTDPRAVCKVSKHEPRISPTHPLIPVSEQLAVFQAYRITPNASKHYSLDFLVPLQLGGSTSIKNVWPISTTKGVGFNQKQLLNVRMHILVCHGEMPLAEAQRMMAEDWVALWVRYGA
jgi:hypothetical protein